jgi:hypothetical protein
MKFDTGNVSPPGHTAYSLCARIRKFQVMNPSLTVTHRAAEYLGSKYGS